VDPLYVWCSGIPDHNRIGLYLIPPFGATRTILIVLPDAPVAQPYVLVLGSVIAGLSSRMEDTYGRCRIQNMARPFTLLCPAS
jgi:CBS-domain-containing membrane protein